MLYNTVIKKGGPTMTVLLDLEWIEKDGIHLTQLSALRVNDDWNIMSNLDIIANPGNNCLNDPNHIALGGLSPVIFENGVTEQDAILTFNEWLLPGDEVWVWAKSNLRLLAGYNGSQTAVSHMCIPWQSRLERKLSAATMKPQVRSPWLPA